MLAAHRVKAQKLLRFIHYFNVFLVARILFLQKRNAKDGQQVSTDMDYIFINSS